MLHLYGCAVVRRKSVTELKATCEFNGLPACAKWIKCSLAKDTTNLLLIRWLRNAYTNFLPELPTLHLTCTLREWPFLYCTIKATISCVIPQEIPMEKTICSGASHKWLTVVEHSIRNYSLSRRQIKTTQPFILCGTEEHLRDLENFPLTQAKEDYSSSVCRRDA